MKKSSMDQIRVKYIIDALRQLGGTGTLEEISAKVYEKLRGRKVTKTYRNSIRARIYERSSDCPKSFHYRKDLFYSAGGGRWGLREMDPLSPVSNDGFLDPVQADFVPAEGTCGEYREGGKKFITHLRSERSRKLVRDFKRSLTDFSCCVCGFDFEKHYGILGRDFIEAHHTAPVAELDKNSTTSLQDLAAVCSNCHRMLHRGTILDINSLRKKLVRCGAVCCHTPRQDSGRPLLSQSPAGGETSGRAGERCG